MEGGERLRKGDERSKEEGEKLKEGGERSKVVELELADERRVSVRAEERLCPCLWEREVSEREVWEAWVLKRRVGEERWRAYHRRYTCRRESRSRSPCERQWVSAEGEERDAERTGSSS